MPQTWPLEVGREKYSEKSTFVHNLCFQRFAKERNG